MVELNSTINQLDLIHIYKIVHPTTEKTYVLLKLTTFTTLIHYIRGHKIHFTHFKK